MSRALLTPNHCSCTVNRARNLPDKGKAGGIDAFCTISLGKEKFVTAVVEKTTTPDWHEQCDMAITDADSPIKLTIYHNNKNSLSKGDFIGRALVSLRDLPDYDRVHTNWYKLANKDGKLDKNRGEIEVSLQFYSKNDTTGSVLDLATKKKHVSLRDIKHSLSSKLKLASKDRRHSEAQGGDNKLGDQRRRLGGNDGSGYFDDSPSESASITGSQLSLSSASHRNNVDHRKKNSRGQNAETPRSTHRSITSDYETSSILDSASMYGGDENSISSASNQNPIPIPQPREVNVDEPRPTITKKKTKDPAPILVVTKPIDTTETKPRSDSIFGLTTIKENQDHDEHTRRLTDDELDFDNYFNKVKQPTIEKKTKKQAPVLPPSTSKEPRRSNASFIDEIRTPSTSISYSTNPFLTDDNFNENTNDSTDDDVDELLGNLERMSSMRSSVKRKIRPREDIMEQSFTEPTGGFNQTPTNHRKPPTALPDVVDQRGTSPGQRPPKPPTKGLCVLGYENVKGTPVNPKVRQELEYTDREDLLHIIAHQSDIIKKRDTRLKDLEQYTDGLLVKIVEQCPAILQSDTFKFNTNKDF